MFIGMIWRPTPDRLRSFNQTREFWCALGDVRLFDSGHRIFNRAASRNLAVREAERLGHSKMVLSDADTIPEHAAVIDAFRTADDTAVHLPYTSCRVLDRTGKPILELGFTCGGVYVTTTKAWWAVGGQDELFDRWAPEDFAFKMAHETFAGPMVRHEGVLLSLSHDRDPHRHGEQDDDPLVQLYRRYEAANGHPDMMKALCFPS